VTEVNDSAAYGGAGWVPRAGSSADEIGGVWAPHAVSSEYAPLLAVLLHRPGPELAVPDADAALMFEAPDPATAAAEHDALAGIYRAAGVDVHYVEPPVTPPPNQIFAADLLFMTHAGAIVARPASAARAGEERWLARRLVELGVPILRSVAGTGTFEGADATWLDQETVLVGRGPRTNAEGAAQVAGTLRAVGVTTLTCDLPFGTMHLMGQLRIVDRDLAIVWPGRIAYSAVEALRARGIRVHAVPDEREAEAGHALNFVVLGPRRIVMPAGNPVTEQFYRGLGIEVTAVGVAEITKAAGAIGCLTGVLGREGGGGGTDRRHR
jgi:arginine deiminase